MYSRKPAKNTTPSISSFFHSHLGALFDLFTRLSTVIELFYLDSATEKYRLASWRYYIEKDREEVESSSGKNKHVPDGVVEYE
jgi:hypothetical protein